jgi:peptidylprolyl isomerase
VKQAAACTILLLALLSGCSSPAVTMSPPVSPSAPAHVEREAIQFDTQAGPLTVLLYPEAAPKTVALMKQYVQEGYYVGRAFYRTVPGHVIQVSDATGGMTDDARRVPLETNATFHFSAGAVGIARDSDPGSGGPEFFVMDFATSHLDGNYTVWGQVISDLAVVHDIATRPAADSSAVPGPAPNLLPFDRMALVPVQIAGAHLVTLSLPEAQAAHYPLRVARNVRAGDLRHSLEAPADLHAGAAGNLTWYIRAYGNAAAPTEGVSVRDSDGAVALGHAESGVYPLRWVPATPGPHALRFFQGDTLLATLTLDVPASAPQPALVAGSPPKLGT